mmetsp:Transcript_16525/g.42410  ORF Transcript_16525/g.42410 Transcript_16525/m.42410 type:complete len:130 (-) Transcript_16525:244-633(-)
MQNWLSSLFTTPTYDTCEHGDQSTAVPLTSSSTWRRVRDRAAADLTSSALLGCSVPDWFQSEFSMASRLEDAKSLLKDDGHVASLRYELVPAFLSEENFWCLTFFLLEHPQSEATGADVHRTSAARDAG